MRVQCRKCHVRYGHAETCPKYQEFKGHDPVRFTHQNERVCDFARRDVNAGIHKHVIENEGGDPGTVICVACGRIWFATVEALA